MRIPEVNAFLLDVLGVDLGQPRPWPQANRLPLGLRSRFKLLECQLDDDPILLLIDAGDDQGAPRKLAEDVRRIAAVAPHYPILLRDAITPYERSRLIKERVAFVVPGSQIYAPRLGIYLTQRFPKPPIPDDSPPSPSAQAVLLHLLLRGVPDAGASVGDVPEGFGYTATTLRRAFHQLGKLDAFELLGTGSGHEMRLQLKQPPRDAWKSSLPRLQSPVKRSFELLASPRVLTLPLAGESVLAARTELAAPPRTIRAIDAAAFNELRKEHDGRQAEPDDPDAVTVQIWRYPPEPLAGQAPSGAGSLADPLSVFLSLADETDDRIAIACEQMIGDLPW